MSNINIMLDSETIKLNFGLTVKELRVNKGLTQEKLAEYLNLDIQTINKIETGKNFTSSEVLADLCNFFNVDISIFFKRKPN